MSKGTLLLSLLLLLLSSSGSGLAMPAAATQPTWPQRFYNPKSARDDLTLPMPCGGAMTFRPVEVPSSGWLSDRQVDLGQDDPKVGYKEGRRLSYIAGAFTDPANSQRRYYYLAKYETTRDQYAVFGTPCPQPSIRGSQPIDAVSWYEAMNFGRLYTEWLLQNARSELPAEGEETGFLRLPTEEEWEFAARGGLKVDETQFVAAKFPMPEGDLAQYAWYQGTESMGGRTGLNPIGLLKPNPLGLHDMLGNASEMVFIPFQLDRRGRPHGQPGGFVSRGGDILTSRDRVRTAARDEHPFFDHNTGKAAGLRGLGFRLVLTAPVIVSYERLHQIQEEWVRLPRLMGKPGQEANLALASLSTVTNETKDDKSRAALEAVKHDLEKAHTEINATRDRAVKALIRMGAFLGNKVKTDDVRRRSIEQALVLARSSYQQLERKVQGKANAGAILNKARADLAEIEENRKKVQTSLDNSLSYYGDMVLDVARDYSKEIIDPQLEILKIEFKEKQSEYLIGYADLFANHIKAYQELKKADKQEWLDAILSQ